MWFFLSFLFFSFPSFFPSLFLSFFVATNFCLSSIRAGAITENCCGFTLLAPGVAVHKWTDSTQEG